MQAFNCIAAGPGKSKINRDPFTRFINRLYSTSCSISSDKTILERSFLITIHRPSCVIESDPSFKSEYLGQRYRFVPQNLNFRGGLELFRVNGEVWIGTYPRLWWSKCRGSIKGNRIDWLNARRISRKHA